MVSPVNNSVNPTPSQAKEASSAPITAANADPTVTGGAVGKNGAALDASLVTSGSTTYTIIQREVQQQQIQQSQQTLDLSDATKRPTPRGLNNVEKLI